MANRPARVRHMTSGVYSRDAPRYCRRSSLFSPIPQPPKPDPKPAPPPKPDPSPDPPPTNPIPQVRAGPLDLSMSLRRRLLYVLFRALLELRFALCGTEVILIAFIVGTRRRVVLVDRHTADRIDRCVCHFSSPCVNC